MNKIGIVLGCAALLSVTAHAIAQTAVPPPAGRLLASNCFQCHGTDGRGGFEEIAGKSAEGLFSELKEMQRKTPGNDLMVPHAKGYSDEQLRAIAAYLSTIR
jgi:cytochrome c553